MIKGFIPHAKGNRLNAPQALPVRPSRAIRMKIRAGRPACIPSICLQLFEAPQAVKGLSPRFIALIHASIFRIRPGLDQGQRDQNAPLCRRLPVKRGVRFMQFSAGIRKAARRRPGKRLSPWLRHHVAFMARATQL